MDTHYGKYQGTAAALFESWALDGGSPDHETSDGQGNGTAVWTSRGGFTLSWSEARELMGDFFEATLDDLDELSAEMASARALVYSWDDQGFVYGWCVSTIDDLAEILTEVERLNDEEAAAAEAEEAEWMAQDGGASLSAVALMLASFGALYVVAHVATWAARAMGGAF